MAYFSLFTCTNTHIYLYKYSYTNTHIRIFFYINLQQIKKPQLYLPILFHRKMEDGSKIAFGPGGSKPYIQVDVSIFL